MKVIVLKIEQCNFLIRKKLTSMDKPGLSLKSIKSLESSGSREYYQILLILSIREALDTFKRVFWSFKSWIPDVLNQSSFKPVIIPETFRQLLGPQNHRKFVHFVIIHLFIFMVNKTFTNHLKHLKNFCKICKLYNHQLGYWWVTHISILQTLHDPFQNIILNSRINYDSIAIPVKHTIYWMSFKYQQLTRRKWT